MTNRGKKGKGERERERERGKGYIVHITVPVA